MKISLQSKTDSSSATIIVLFEKDKAEKNLLDKNKSDLVDRYIKKKTFTGEKDEVVHTHLNSPTRIQKIVLYGLGKSKDFNDHQARNFAAKIIKASKTLKETQLSIVIHKTVQKHLQAFVEGLVMGNFDPASQKTGKEKKEKEEKKIKIINLISKSWSKEQKKLVENAKLIGEVVNYTRNIVNLGPRLMNTSQLVKEIKGIAKTNKYKLTDLNKKRLEKLKMGGILAVNRGSEEPAHLMIIEHNHRLKEKPIIIAGKGIIFDTGGISLKPSSHLHEMQLDIDGAAVDGKG